MDGELWAAIAGALVGALAAGGVSIALYWWQRKEAKSQRDQEVDSSIQQISADFAERRYAELDRLHFDLLRMRIERPELSPEGFLRPLTSDWAMAAAQREYGCLVWSFIESIVDYCDRPGRNFGAWAPAVSYEASAYRSWLTPENLGRFEPEFVTRVERLIAAHQASLGNCKAPPRLAD